MSWSTNYTYDYDNEGVADLQDSNKDIAITMNISGFRVFILILYFYFFINQLLYINKISRTILNLI